MAESVPPEILGKIFFLVPRVTTAEFKGRFIPNAIKAKFEGITFAEVTELVPLTTVCRYWRDVALGTPFLWSTVLDRIDLLHRSPPFLHYIHRCPSGSLFVHCPVSPSYALEELLHTNGHRVRAIRLRCEDYPEPRLVRLLSMPLPSLTDCALQPWAYPDQLHRLDIFGGLSTLRTLQIVGALLPLAPLPCLTTLSLVHFGAFSESTITHLLDLLSRAPKLETISWSLGPACMIWPDTTPALPWRHVQLHDLKSIILEIFYSMTRIEPADVSSPFPIRLLQHLSFPPSCEVSIKPVYPATFAPIVNIISAERRATHLRLCYNIYRTAVYLDAVDAEHAHKISLGITIGDCMNLGAGDARRTDLGTRMSGLAFFANIRALWVQHQLSSEIQRLFDPEHSVLRALPRLECLLLSNYLPRAKERAPFTPIGKLVRLLEAGSTDGEQVWCPALSVIAFSIWEKPGWDDGCVRRLIESRAEAGCALERLLVGQWSRTDGSGPADEPGEAAEDICAVHEYDGRGTALRVYTGADAADIVHEASRWRMDGTRVLDFRSMFELY